MSKKGLGWRPEAFRDMALERVRTCNHIGKLCEELGISRSTLRAWRKQQKALHAVWPATIEFAGETLFSWLRTHPKLKFSTTRTGHSQPVPRPSRPISVSTAQDRCRVHALCAVRV